MELSRELMELSRELMKLSRELMELSRELMEARSIQFSMPSRDCASALFFVQMGTNLRRRSLLSRLSSSAGILRFCCSIEYRRFLPACFSSSDRPPLDTVACADTTLDGARTGLDALSGMTSSSPLVMHSGPLHAADFSEVSAACQSSADRFCSDSRHAAACSDGSSTLSHFLIKLHKLLMGSSLLWLASADSEQWASSMIGFQVTRFFSGVDCTLRSPVSEMSCRKGRREYSRSALKTDQDLADRVFLRSLRRGGNVSTWETMASFGEKSSGTRCSKPERNRVWLNRFESRQVKMFSDLLRYT